jgi:hypothetical protein
MTNASGKKKNNSSPKLKIIDHASWRYIYYSGVSLVVALILWSLGNVIFYSIFNDDLLAGKDDPKSRVLIGSIFFIASFLSVLFSAWLKIKYFYKVLLVPIFLFVLVGIFLKIISVHFSL